MSWHRTISLLCMYLPKGPRKAAGYSCWEFNKLLSAEFAGNAKEFVIYGSLSCEFPLQVCYFLLSPFRGSIVIVQNSLLCVSW